MMNRPWVLSNGNIDDSNSDGDNDCREFLERNEYDLTTSSDRRQQHPRHESGGISLAVLVADENDNDFDDERDDHDQPAEYGGQQQPGPIWYYPVSENGEGGGCDQNSYKHDIDDFGRNRRKQMTTNRGRRHHRRAAATAAARATTDRGGIKHLLLGSMIATMTMMALGMSYSSNSGVLSVNAFTIYTAVTTIPTVSVKTNKCRRIIPEPTSTTTLLFSTSAATASQPMSGEEQQQEMQSNGSGNKPPVKMVVEKLSDTVMFHRNMLDDSVYHDISKLCQDELFFTLDRDRPNTELEQKIASSMERISPSQIKRRMEQQHDASNHQHVTTEMFLAYEMRLATPEEAQEYHDQQILRQKQAAAVAREVAEQQQQQQHHQRRGHNHHHNQPYNSQRWSSSRRQQQQQQQQRRRQPMSVGMEPDFADFNRPKKQYHDPYRNEELFPHHPNDPMGGGGGGRGRGHQSMQAQQKANQQQNRRRANGGTRRRHQQVHTNVVNSATSNNEMWGVDRPMMDLDVEYYDDHADFPYYDQQQQQYGRRQSSSPDVVIGGTSGAFDKQHGATRPGWGADQGTTNGSSARAKQRRVPYQPGMVDSTTGWSSSSGGSTRRATAVGGGGTGGRKPAGGSPYVHGQNPLYAHSSHHRSKRNNNPTAGVGMLNNKARQQHRGYSSMASHTGPLFAHYPMDDSRFGYGAEAGDGRGDGYFEYEGGGNTNNGEYFDGSSRPSPNDDGMFSPRKTHSSSSPPPSGGIGGRPAGTQSYQSFKRKQQRRQQQHHQQQQQDRRRYRQPPMDRDAYSQTRRRSSSSAAGDVNAPGELYVRGDLIGFVEVSHEPYSFGQFEPDKSILDAKFVPHRCVIRNLVVAKDYQRSGVGNKLVEEIETHVRNHFNLHEIVCEVDYLSVAATAPIATPADFDNDTTNNKDDDKVSAAMKFFMDNQGYEMVFTEPETDTTVRRDVLRKDLKRRKPSSSDDTAGSSSGGGSTNPATTAGVDETTSSSSSSTRIDDRPGVYQPHLHAPRSGSDVNVGMHGIPNSYAKVHPGEGSNRRGGGGGGGTSENDRIPEPTDYSSESNIVDVDDFVVESVDDEDDDDDVNNSDSNVGGRHKSKRVVIPVDPF